MVCHGGRNAGTALVSETPDSPRGNPVGWQPEPAADIELVGPIPGGLLSDIQWNCSLAEGSCSPSDGSGALDTEFSLAPGEEAIIVWQGCPDPSAAWVNIAASASLGDGSLLLLPENAEDLFYLSVNDDGLFRDRFE